MLYYHYIVQTNFSGMAKNWWSALFLLGGTLVAGSFLWHAFVDKVEEKHTALPLLAVGFTLVLASVVALCLGIAQL